MAYNVVRDWSSGKVLFRTRRGLDAACNWMMSRIETLDINETSADSIYDNGELGGSWFISDLLDENPDGWELDDGTVIIGHRDYNTGSWIIERRHK